MIINSLQSTTNNTKINYKNNDNGMIANSK